MTWQLPFHSSTLRILRRQWSHSKYLSSVLTFVRRISGPFFPFTLFSLGCQRKWKYVTHTFRFSVFQWAASRRESFDVAGLEDGACREVVSAPHVRLQPPGSSAPLSGGGPSAVRHERPPASAALFADGQMTQTESSHARLLLAVDHQRPERRRTHHPTCSLQFARCQNKVSERRKRSGSAFDPCWI